MNGKRSGDVTAAAVVLLCGSGLLLLLGGFTVLTMVMAAAPAGQGQVGVAGMLMMVAMYAGLAGWGIATGVGVLKLRPWARISMIVISAFAMAGCVFGGIGIFAAQTLLKGGQQAQLPAAAVNMMLAIFGFVLVMPLGIAIWWMILFTRKRVAMEFASRGAAEAIAATSFDAQSAPIAPARPQIPLSIRLVAVLYIIGSAMIFVSLEYMRQTAMPTVVLGMLVEGRRAQAFMLALGLVQLGLCIAVLKRRAWALDGLIAISVFGTVNTVSFGLSPAWKEALARTVRIQQLPPGVAAETMNRFMNTLLPLSLIVGGVLAVVMLYFLVTRRKEFRAACAGGNSQ